MQSIAHCMKVSFIIVAIMIGAASGQTGAKIRIGLLNLQTQVSDAKTLDHANERLQVCLAKDGMVEVFTQARIAKALEQVGRKMPRHWRDPRTVLDIGSTINVDRMVYGTIDVNNNEYGVHLYCLDVMMRMTIGEASIVGDPGAPLDTVLAAAVAQMNGKLDKTKPIKKYFGPEIHNVKQLLIASGAWIGAGVIWGLVNYANSGKGGTATAYDRDIDLTGIPASADQIAMFARPAALGNAYVAASDDAYGVLYNPAGMAWVRGAEAILGYQYRFGLDNIAASYVNKATREIGFGNAFLYSGDREGLMSELYFYSAVAYKFNQIASFMRPISLGASVKLISERTKGQSDDPNSITASSFGASVDFGILAELSEQIKYGLLLRDIPVVNKWNNTTTGERYNEALATTLHMGGTYQAGYTTVLIAEGQIPITDDQAWKMAGGLEQEFFRVMFVRLGLQKQIQSYYETPWKVTCGFGLRVISLNLDVSYEYNTLKMFDVLNTSFKIAF